MPYYTVPMSDQLKYLDEEFSKSFSPDLCTQMDLITAWKVKYIERQQKNHSLRASKATSGPGGAGGKRKYKRQS